MTRTALVTGGNRGIGLEACRQLAGSGMEVVLAARDRERGEQAAQELQDEGLNVTHEPLDVTDRHSVEDCVRRLADAGTEIDVLVNNAGVYPTEGVFSVSEETLVMALEVNTLGPFRTCQAFVPGMVRRGYGRVVNVSSGGGSFGEGLGPAAYAVSKAALNALTVKVSQAVRGNVKVNAMCPGWVRTDMGGSGAPRSPEEAADTLVWLATLSEDGPNGGFFRDRKPIPWQSIVTFPGGPQALEDVPVGVYQAFWPDVPIAEGTVLDVLGRHFGVWSLVG